MHAQIAAAFGALAASLQLSASLLSSGAPFWQIHVALAAAAALNWRVFDGTRQGLALALLCGLGAPAIEVAINSQLLQLWHYPRGDVLGGQMVSWVPWCYFFYTPALSSLARFVWAEARPPAALPPGGARQQGRPPSQQQ